MAPLAGLMRSTSAPPVEELRIWKVCIPALTCRQPVPHAPADTVMTLAAGTSGWRVPQPDIPAAIMAASMVPARTGVTGTRRPATRETRTREPRTGRHGNREASIRVSRTGGTFTRGVNGRGRAGRTSAGTRPPQHESDRDIQAGTQRATAG